MDKFRVSLFCIYESVLKDLRLKPSTMTTSVITIILMCREEFPKVECAYVSPKALANTESDSIYFK